MHPPELPLPSAEGTRALRPLDGKPGVTTTTTAHMPPPPSTPTSSPFSSLTMLSLSACQRDASWMRRCCFSCSRSLQGQGAGRPGGDRWAYVRRRRPLGGWGQGDARAARRSSWGAGEGHCDPTCRMRRSAPPHAPAWWWALRAGKWGVLCTCNASRRPALLGGARGWAVNARSYGEACLHAMHGHAWHASPHPLACKRPGCRATPEWASCTSLGTGCAPAASATAGECLQRGGWQGRVSAGRQRGAQSITPTFYHNRAEVTHQDCKAGSRLT